MTKKRTRTCRFEELEGREMLSATPWLLVDDYSAITYSAITPEPATVSPFVEVSEVVKINGGTAASSLLSSLADDTVALTLTNAVPTPTPTTAIPTPTKPTITATTVTNTSITLSGFEPGEYYIIQYGVEGKGGISPKIWMSLVDDFDYGDYYVGGTTVTFTGLIAGTNYQFRAIQVAYSADYSVAVRSDWSDSVKATTTGNATVLSDKLDKAAAANKVNKDLSTKHRVTVSWGVVDGITSYVITYTIPSGVKGVPGYVVQEVITSNAGNTASGVLTHAISGLNSATSYKVSIVGVDANGAATKAVTVTQKTLKETVKAPAKLGVPKGEKPSIDTVKLTWGVVPGAESYYIQVWSPKTKTSAPALVRHGEITAAEYASATFGGLANGLTIDGLTASTKYTFAVLAHKDTGATTERFETVFACKAISTAKYPAPKLSLGVSSQTAAIPNYKSPFTADNYTHYELYYVDADKKEVHISSYSLTASQVNPKEKVTLTADMLYGNTTAAFADFLSYLSNMGTRKVKFVLKAVTKDASDATVNWSAGGSSSMRADYVRDFALPG